MCLSFTDVASRRDIDIIVHKGGSVGSNARSIPKVLRHIVSLCISRTFNTWSNAASDLIPQLSIYHGQARTLPIPRECQRGATGTYPKKRFIETQHATGPTAVVTLARDLGKNIVLDASLPGYGLQGVSLLGFELEEYLTLYYDKLASMIISGLCFLSRRPSNSKVVYFILFFHQGGYARDTWRYHGIQHVSMDG